MSKKRDFSKSHGEKLMELLRIFMVSRRKYSLRELAEELNCSKQTVLRLTEKIEDVYGTRLDRTRAGKKLYFHMSSIDRPKAPQPFTDAELQVLFMCRTFTAHLLGREFFEQARNGILKSAGAAERDRVPSLNFFGAFQHGTIDYTPHQETIRTIINAIEHTRICKITYRSHADKEPNSFYIRPLKIFSHQNTLYLHAQKARTPGRVARGARFDPLLAVHRIQSIEPTDRLFQYPADFNFEKAFPKSFGVMKNEAFNVTVRFSGWARRYVAERMWSDDQKITNKKSGEVELTFTASSQAELISWILSFGEHARVMKPAWLVKEVKKRIGEMAAVYGG